MNAVEIINLSKNFGNKKAVDNLNMTVKEGAIYGFIGENGSGKSTTEKLICGLLHPNNGSIKIFGKDYMDDEVRKSIGCLIEMPGCFPNLTVLDNMKIQASNIGLKNKEEEIRNALKTVRMEGSASNKFKNCSLGMKQRIAIAMALLGRPKLLILDEPINGLDLDGVRIMREVFIDITKTYGSTIIISSHILNELEKVATHYGIIRHGKMIKEMTAEELNNSCRTFIQIKSKKLKDVYDYLKTKYLKVELLEEEIRVFDEVKSDEIVEYLFKNNVEFSEVLNKKISLEEYYIDLMKEGK